MKILLVDDDPRLRELVGIALERKGYQVLTAADGQAAVTHALREKPDLIVLDIGLPEIDGFEVCRRIRTHSQVPVVFLTARDDEIDRILGFEMGADDYVTKPFSPRELVARVHAVLKRTNGGDQPALWHHGQITLDRDAHECRIGTKQVVLTAKEFTILAFLMGHPTRVHPRTQLITSVWGANSQVSDRTLDSHLRNLRSKLADAGCKDAVKTVHGVGIGMGDCM